MAQVDIRIIPPLTVDEEAFLLRERGITPWRRMSRAEIEEQYPGALTNYALNPTNKLVGFKASS